MSDINIGAILRDAVRAGAQEVQQVTPQAEDFLREITKGHKAALQALAEALARGDIDRATFDDEMDDEAKTLAAELAVIAVVEKAVAQRAVNAFRKALIEGMTQAVGAAAGL